MTSENDTPTAASDSPQPDLRVEQPRIQELGAVSPTTWDTSHVAATRKKVTLHTIPSHDLRIPYDVEEEGERLANLRANRPEEPPSSSASS